MTALTFKAIEEVSSPSSTLKALMTAVVCVEFKALQAYYVWFKHSQWLRHLWEHWQRSGISTHIFESQWNLGGNNVPGASELP